MSDDDMRRSRTTAIPLLGRRALPLVVAALVLTSCTPVPEVGPGGGSTAASEAASDDGSAGSARDGAPSGPAAPTDDADADAKADDAKADGAGGSPERDGDEQPGGDGNGGRPGSDGSGGQSGGDGSEVAPPAPDRSAGDRLGDAVGSAAGTLAPGQVTGTAAGLVAGFPDDVVLVPTGATVVSSSVTGTDGRFQVTLDARVDGACAAAALDYRAWFTTGGFRETGAATQPDSATVDLARDDGTVQLGTTRMRSGCEVTVFAALSAR